MTIKSVMTQMVDMYKLNLTSNIPSLIDCFIGCLSFLKFGKEKTYEMHKRIRSFKRERERERERERVQQRWLQV